MSERSETTWACSRCGVTEVTPYGQQPPHWTRWWFASPPRGERRDPVGDLCNECGGDLVSFALGNDLDVERRVEADHLVAWCEVQDTTAARRMGRCVYMGGRLCICPAHWRPRVLADYDLPLSWDDSVARGVASRATAYARRLIYRTPAERGAR